MRTFGKVLAVLGIVLLLLVVAGVTFAAWTVHRSFPQTSGSVTLQGLRGSVDVYRNDRGIPDLYADDPADLFFAQGYVHAQDRFWEMDFRRHITAGRLSELFGRSQLETDTFLRISGWRRVAEQEYALLSPSTRQNLDDYAKGVNAYLADHSGAAVSLEYAVLGLQNSSYTIEPWTPVDSLAWLKAMAWDLRGNMQEEIERSVVSAKIGNARTAQIFPPYPYAEHRPIVTQGAVENGVWNPDGVASVLATGARQPHVPVDADEREHPRRRLALGVHRAEQRPEDRRAHEVHRERAPRVRRGQAALHGEPQRGADRGAQGDEQDGLGAHSSSSSCRS